MRPRRWRRESCNELLVQQLVLACSAAVRKELVLLQLGLSQRCAGGSYRDLRGYGRAIAMQIGCCALPLASQFLHVNEPSPVPGDCPKTYQGLVERKTIRGAAPTIKLSASRNSLRTALCGVDAASGTGRASTSSHGPAAARCPTAAHTPQRHDRAPHLRRWSGGPESFR